jgi:hypothetical protein
MDVFLDDLRRIGFAGVQNFPTVGLIDGTFRANLEETGMSYGLEVDMIAKARAKDMLTTPYVFSEDDAAAMARAGADIIVCHLGLTTGAAGEARRHHPRPRRAGGHARGRRIHHAGNADLPRLLRRLVDGASAGGGRADGTDAALQAHQGTVRNT